MVLASTAFAQTGWIAPAERVAADSKQFSEFNYVEQNVPAYELPDPLRRNDGARVASVADWPARRAEILELFEAHVYGRSPGAPAALSFEVVETNPQAMEGAATLKRVAIRSENNGVSHAFEVVLFTPNSADGPVPLFLLMNNRRPRNTDPTREHKSPFWPAEEVIARGYGVAAMQVRQLAPDHKERWRDGVVSLFEAKDAQQPDGWGTLAAWGWGASRALDYLATDAAVDGDRVAVVGHSRGGKAALWAAAVDERFAIAISNSSGCGGAALSRRRYGETLASINRGFPHWFCANFHQFNGREDALPVDQHQLISLIAPRAVYVASSDQDLWADPRGEFLSVAHASSVYGLWGAPVIAPDDMPALNKPLVVGRRGYHIRSGSHDLTVYDWQRFMDFADQVWPTK